MSNLTRISILAAILTTTAQADPEQAKIDAVKAGHITEARASWWGFDPADATQCLQNAIDSGARRVIVEDMGRPWIVTPLQAASDQEIVLERGVVLLAKKGEFRGTGDSLLSVVNKQNVTIRGYGAALRMHRDDYAQAPYRKAEWRNTLQIRSSRNVNVFGLTMSESGGDGIYLGVGTRGITNQDIHIKDVVLDKHYRQGISVITARNLLIEDTVMRNTAGTAPMAGIDFEPNASDEMLVNCVLRNCVAEDNQGVGYAFYLPNMTAQSEPISIRLENCVARGSNRSPLSFTNGEGGGHGPMTGTFDCVDCDFSGGRSSAITFTRKPATGARVRFVNCRIAAGRAGPETPVIAFKSSPDDQQDVGGVSFENCVVEKPPTSPLLRFVDVASDLHLIDVAGTLQIRTGDASSSFTITPDWLNSQHRGNTVKRFPPYPTDKRSFRPLQPEGIDQTFPQHPFRQRREGTVVVYANQGQEVNFTLEHVQVGKYAGQPLIINAIGPDGKTLNVGQVPFQTKTPLGFIAPQTGVYHIPIQCGPNAFQLLSSNCPALISNGTRRVWFVYSVGDLYFHVPAGTSTFGVRVFGEGNETVAAEIVNPQGKSVWKNPLVTLPEQYVGKPGSSQSEVWKLRISKPASGAMEDYFVELQGIPPFLATHPSSLLHPME